MSESKVTIVQRAAARAAREAAVAINAAMRADNALRDFHVDRFGRHREGYFHAQVRVGDSPPVYVSCQWGSWLIPTHPGSHAGREVLSPYRDVLAERAAKFEARERLQLKQQEAANARASAGNNSPKAGDARGVHQPVPADRLPA